jgi:two-component system sensor histidine kinase AlgZ
MFGAVNLHGLAAAPGHAHRRRALPATLAWLIVACSAQEAAGPAAQRGSSGCGVLLGALAGLYGCGLLALVGLLVERALGGQSAFAGALLVGGAGGGAGHARAKGAHAGGHTARLTELQSRIRPHFLFNTLNSAIALVRAEPAKAEALLEDLSDLFRHALVDQGESVTLADEIALAQRYLAIEQVRFGDRLQVEWALDPRPTAPCCRRCCCSRWWRTRSPRRGAQRAGRHGPRVTQRRGSVVVIKVTNTVPAGQGRPGHGLALDNVRDRLRCCTTCRASFQRPEGRRVPGAHGGAGG